MACNAEGCSHLIDLRRATDRGGGLACCKSLDTVSLRRECRLHAWNGESALTESFEILVGWENDANGARKLI